MSGGYFNYNQYKFIEIADQLEVLLCEPVEETTRAFPPEVCNDITLLRKRLLECYTRLNALDYLICDDYGIERYNKRMKELELKDYSL
jgi:hypothetical protein